MSCPARRLAATGNGAPPPSYAACVGTSNVNGNIQNAIDRRPDSVTQAAQSTSRPQRAGAARNLDLVGAPGCAHA